MAVGTKQRWGKCGWMQWLVRREMGYIGEIRDICGGEKEEKEGGKDEEENKDAKMSAVNDGREGPRREECGHEGKEKCN